LAEKAGMKLNGIRDIEQGINKPSWETVIALCKALGVKCDEFMRPPSPGSHPIAVGRPRKATADADGQTVEEPAPKPVETMPGPAKGKAKGRRKA
jgi:transcriptional regulator with XRE-family HTH domain